jgi:hypothetical protein
VSDYRQPEDRHQGRARPCLEVGPRARDRLRPYLVQAEETRSVYRVPVTTSVPFRVRPSRFTGRAASKVAEFRTPCRERILRKTRMAAVMVMPHKRVHNLSASSSCHTSSLIDDGSRERMADLAGVPSRGSPDVLDHRYAITVYDGHAYDLRVSSQPGGRKRWRRAWNVCRVVP